MARIKAGGSAGRKELITQKAAALFRTKGFTAASMRDLAEAVGVEAPSLYNHIGSKSELLQSICFKIANEFMAHLDQTEATQQNSIQQLEQVIRFHIRMMLEKFDEVFVANHEWKSLTEPYLSNFLGQRRIYEKRLTALVEQGIKNKELLAIHPYVAVLTILSAVRGLEFWQRHNRNVSASVLENDMVNHLLKGLIK